MQCLSMERLIFKNIYVFPPSPYVVENMYMVYVIYLRKNYCLYASLTEVVVSYRILYKYQAKGTNIYVFMYFFPFLRKEMIAQQREYKKKKALKKAQRIKELEQEREDQKVKWQQFNNRAYSKNKKGQVCSHFVCMRIVTGYRILCVTGGRGGSVF